MSDATPPQTEDELERLQKMADQLRDTLARLKEQIDAAEAGKHQKPPPAGQKP